MIRELRACRGAVGFNVNANQFAGRSWAMHFLILKLFASKSNIDCKEQSAMTARLSSNTQVINR
ncbi:MAG TPA: hypothetical protein VI566_04130, partial [Xanthomonadales bacterium]|nr:hypothetical protein [Xanthomonadales bacterium]